MALYLLAAIARSLSAARSLGHPILAAGARAHVIRPVEQLTGALERTAYLAGEWHIRLPGALT
jgi:hypothetical protein